MSAEEDIAELDRDLERGQRIRLIRVGGPNETPFECRPMAWVRGFDPTEIVPGSGLTMQSIKVIISPTTLNETGWPGALTRPQTKPRDKRIPIRNDMVVTKLGEARIQAATGLYNGDTLVRIEMTAQGEG